MIIVGDTVKLRRPKGWMVAHHLNYGKVTAINGDIATIQLTEWISTNVPIDNLVKA